jgi:SAM-dependent methyltransferase
MVRRDLHEQNRLSWNQATRAHNSHKQDQARFLREGGSTLFPEEIELLGDIRGLSLLHLQCNAGQDTLSLARLGAVVTGVDISDEAIAFAGQLADDSGIPATFIRMDIYDWLEQTAPGSQRFDIVFCSYGALCWLSDLRLWAKGIADILKPKGCFVCVEFHPFSMVFDDQDWTPKYPYFGENQASSWPEGIGDYVAASGEALTPSGYLAGVQDFQNSCPCHEFQWTLADIVTALLEAGLAITTLKEYPYSNGAKLCQGMRETPGKRMIQPERLPSLPLMFGIVAQKPESSVP